MNLKLLVALAAVLLIGADDANENSAVKGVEDAMHAVNEAFANRDADAFGRLVTDDHVAITPYYGGPQSKAQQLAMLADNQVTEYTMGKVTMTALSDDVVFVGYPLTLKGRYKERSVSGKYYVGAVWVRHDDKWLEASYQETRVDGQQ